MKIIEKKLIELGYQKIETPLLSDFNQTRTYLSEVEQKNAIKVTSPDGRVLNLRYDSTLAMVLSQTNKIEQNIYYFEPNYFYDFEKNQLNEVYQIGIETAKFGIAKVDQINSELAYGLESLELAIILLKAKERTNLLIEVSNESLFMEVLDEVRLEAEEKEKLLYFIKRRNAREIRICLEKNAVPINVIEILVKLTSHPIQLDLVLSMTENVGIFNKLTQWLKIISQRIGGDLLFEGLPDTSKLYYSGLSYRIYDKENHLLSVSGGCYYFEDFEVAGCGFTIPMEVISC